MTHTLAELDVLVGELTEAQNDKMDRDGKNADTTSGADVVIDYQLPTSNNNYTWYRKYKSGWVEQGGRTATFSNTAANTSGALGVTLPITMADTSYSAIGTLSANDNSVSGYSYRIICLHSKTTTGFTFDEWNNAASSSTSCYGTWEVKGMAAT